MRLQLSAALAATVILGGCAAQPSQPVKQQAAIEAPAAAAAPAAPATGADPAAAQLVDLTAPAQIAPKKKCEQVDTGSRLANCHGSADAVKGAGGDHVRDDMRANGLVVTGVPRN
jgi:PBP1b-binding outer membrane lipoprotein LpoB